jgi:P4 family phage/plasmid primase-like protien
MKTPIVDHDGGISSGTAPHEHSPSHEPTEVSRQDDQPKQLPEWKQLLARRGILDQALEAEWHYAEYQGKPGWEISLYDDEGKRWRSPNGKLTSRWKNSSSEPNEEQGRYAWLCGKGNKPKGCDYYHLPHVNLRSAVEKQNHELIIACGEPDTLTFAAVGMLNVTSFFGEKNIPADLVSALQNWNVQVVHYYRDLDETGATAAERLATTLRYSGIELRLYDLPTELEGKPVKDINDAYRALGCNPQRFSKLLSGLEYVLLQNTPVADGAEAVSGASKGKSAKRAKLPEPGKELPDAFYQDLEKALGVLDYQPNGWSKPVACPFKVHEHDDTRPAARYHKEMHIVRCFKCGTTWLAVEVGAVLGLNWRDYTRPKGRKPSSIREDEESSPVSAEEPDRNRKTPPPTDDELGDAIIAEWGDRLTYFHGAFHQYENGFWHPVPGIHGIIWDGLIAYKVDGVRPNSARVSSVKNYLVDKLRVPDELVESGDSYINLQNGLYNLETGELESHQPDLYLTSQLGFAHDPAAECPIWERSLDEWLTTPDGQPDTALAALVQEAIAYSLTADTSREVAFWLYGPPGSGKSTVLRILALLAGNSHLAFDFNMLDKNQYQLADVPGKRVLTCSEARAGSTLPDYILKPLISGERMSARHPYGLPFDFTPIAKLWWAMNERPTNRDSSGAIYRRLIQILFRNPVPADKRDRHLIAKLQEELPGIFNWAMQGLRRLNERDTFTHSSQAAQALDEYKLENDIERQFVEDTEWCILGADQETNSTDLYLAYKAWTDRYTHFTKSGTKVAKEWERLGFTKYKNGSVYYRGIGLTRQAKYIVRSMK